MRINDSIGHQNSRPKLLNETTKRCDPKPRSANDQWNRWKINFFLKSHWISVWKTISKRFFIALIVVWILWFQREVRIFSLLFASLFKSFSHFKRRIIWNVKIEIRIASRLGRLSSQRWTLRSQCNPTHKVLHKKLFLPQILFSLLFEESVVGLSEPDINRLNTTWNHVKHWVMQNK